MVKNKMQFFACLGILFSVSLLVLSVLLKANHSITAPPYTPCVLAHACAQAAAALKARSIALTEEKEIQRLISQVVKRQLTKLQSKLANFEKVRLMFSARICAHLASCGAHLIFCLAALRLERRKNLSAQVDLKFCSISACCCILWNPLYRADSFCLHT